MVSHCKHLQMSYSAKKALAVGGMVAGLGLLYTGLTHRGSSSKQPSIPDYALPLVDIVGIETMRMLALDPVWMELCDRAGEFATTAREQFKELLVAAAKVVAFQVALQLKDNKVKPGTPRIFRTRLHAVIEAVRMMRAAVAAKCPSALVDFDEVAADIQRTHDDYAYNMLLEAHSRM